MLSKCIRFSVRHYHTVLVIAVTFSLYSLYSLRGAGLDIFPEFSAPRVIIQTEAPGLTTEQTEILVTQRIERHLAGLSELDHLRSESIQGLSIVTVVFHDHSDHFLNRQKVSERLATLVGELPDGIGPPIMVPLSSSSATVLTIGLRSEKQNLMELRSWVDWVLTPRLLAVTGVADINVFGGDIQQLQIQPDPQQLYRYGLGLEEVVASAQRATGWLGSGFVENANQRISLYSTGLPVDPQALSQVVVIPAGKVTLGDISKVVIGSKPAVSAAAVNGKPGIVLMVIGQYGANTLSVSQHVERILADYLPFFAQEGIDFYPRLFRPADYIETSLGSLTSHLCIGGLLVVIVLYAFLFNFRTAFISALAIPLSLLAAAVTLLAFGVNLNIMVLGGLAIALGEVVDDAIIDTENIFRRLRENQYTENPRPIATVVYHASLEVRGSVVYASFIVALVFSPLLTLGGVAGKLFAPLGQAYIVAILISLLVALTVIPALCFLLLGKHTPQYAPPLINWLRPYYSRTVRCLLPYPYWTLGISLTVCAVALAFLPALGSEFLPELREGHYIIHTASLPGTSLTETMRVGHRLTEAFSALPEVLSVSQWAGRAERGADTYGSHYSEYEIHLKPLRGIEQATVLKKIKQILNRFPGISYEANSFLTERIEETISGYTAPIAVNLYGNDLDRLDQAATEIAELIRSIPGATQVQVRSPTGTPLLEIALSLEHLAHYGLRPIDVAKDIQTAIQGQKVGYAYRHYRAYEVSVIFSPETREDVESIANIPLKTVEGHFVTLKDVADIQQSEGRYNVLHRGGQRIQTVTAHIVGRDLDHFMSELKRIVLSHMTTLPDVVAEFSGAAIEQRQTREELIVKACLAGVGVLVLIQLAIGNMQHLFLTLINIPFSLGGGVIAAIITGVSLSVGSMVGFVTLFGITVRNALMLVSHYHSLVEKEGHIWSPETALLGAMERLPSILMTALVTALAMLPIAVDSDNPGREIMGPMATVIIGGLVSSTLLTLIVFPVLFARFGQFTGNPPPFSSATATK